MQEQKETLGEIALKQQIGFKTAFKATMGFYVAQLVATLLGLVIFLGVVVVIIGGIILLNRG